MLPIDTSELKYSRTSSDSYEAADLNRVGEFCRLISGSATEELSVISQMRKEYDVAENEFYAPDFEVPEIQVKADYSVTDTYTLEQMRQYLQNIIDIVRAFPPKQYKTIPSSMRFLTADGANNIEEDLKGSAENLGARVNRTKKYIKDTAAIFQYSGELYAGGII